MNRKARKWKKEQLTKIIEELKAKAIKRGKDSEDKSLKAMHYGKALAYSNVLIVMEELSK